VLKEKVLATAKAKWSVDKDSNLSYVKDILDIKYDTLTVIAGTLYKEMVRKPCILKNLGITVVLTTSSFLKIAQEESE
jgi:hypothetical protein